MVRRPYPMLDLHKLLPYLLVVLFSSCAEPQPTTGTQAPQADAQPDIVDDGIDTARSAVEEMDRSTVPFDENGTRYTWTIVPAANGTYGFAIYDRGKLYIDQQKAPGLAGPDGWKNKSDARNAVLAAMEKLEKGEMPEGMNVVGAQ